MNAHQQIFRIYQASIDGSSAPVDQAWMDQHLAECVECRSLLGLYQKLAQEADQQWPITPTPPEEIRTIARKVKASLPQRNGLWSGYLTVQSVVWIVAAAVLIVFLGWVYSNLIPQPAVTTEEAPSTEYPGETIWVQEGLIQAVEDSQENLSFELKVPANLPPEWTYTGSEVEFSPRRFIMKFSRNNTNAFQADTLEISQYDVGPNNDGVFDPRVSQIPPEADYDNIQVSGSAGIYLEGDLDAGSWDPGAPIQRVRWQEGPVVYEVKFTGGAIGRSTLIGIGENLKTLTELDRARYRLVLNVQPEIRNLNLLDHIGGYFGPTFVLGQTMYLGQGAKLSILDVGRPEAVTPLGDILLSELIQKIIVDASTAFVLTSGGEIQILDVSDPTHPTLLNTYRPIFEHKPRTITIHEPAIPLDLVLDGGYAYLLWHTYPRGSEVEVHGESGLQILDLADPAHPNIVGTYMSERPVDSGGLAVNDGYVYLGVGLCWSESCDGAIEVLDVSDPTIPTSVANLADLESVRDIVVSEGFVYLSVVHCEWRGDTLCRGGLEVIDIGNPIRPSPAGRVDLAEVRGNLVVSGEAAFIPLSEGLQIIDLSDPAAPMLGAVIPSEGSSSNITLEGNFAYVTHWTQGLRILDITDPVAPVNLGRYAPELLATTLEAYGSYALLGDLAADRLRILDLTDPVNPAHLVSMATQTGRTVDIAIAEQYAYLAAGDCPEPQCVAGLEIVDLTDPASPRSLGHAIVSQEGFGWKVALSGSVAYVADSRGLALVDISNPTQPTTIGYEVLDNSFAKDLLATSNFVITAGLNEVRVLDFSDPSDPIDMIPQWGRSNPDIATNLATAITAAAANGQVFFSSEEGLLVLDLGDPPNLEVVYQYSPRINKNMGDPAVMEIEGERLFLATGQTLKVLDIRDPYRPEQVGAFGPLPPLRDLMIRGDYIYAVDAFGGLAILQFTQPDPE